MNPNYDPGCDLLSTLSHDPFFFVCFDRVGCTHTEVFWYGHGAFFTSFCINFLIRKCFFTSQVDFLWEFSKVITIVRGFHCAIKTNVLPHLLITETLKTPNKTKHSVLKIIEESLKPEHPALENVRYKQAGWTSAINVTTFYKKTSQREDIIGAAYLLLLKICYLPVKINEVSNCETVIMNCIIKRGGFCDEMTATWTFLSHSSYFPQSWCPKTEFTLHHPTPNKTI